MKELEQLVKDYLDVEKSDYALMINGDWGSGKTFYLKNTLFNSIKGIDSFETEKKGNKKRYNPIYISLYGISTAEDIVEKIQLELNPWLKSKPWAIAQAGANKVLSFFNLGINKEEAKKFISIFNIARHNVLFFDDLERVDKNLDLNSIIGQINQFTEHQNLKVFIVCNSDEVEKKFSKINEKTIRFTNYYTPDLNAIYDEMVSHFSGNYLEYLKNRKEIILKIFNDTSHKNLRTLQFILDIFQKIYSATVGAEYFEDIIDTFLYFVVIYSIEFKNGRSQEFLKETKKLGPFDINFDIEPMLPAEVEPKPNDAPKDEKTLYYDNFREKYKSFLEVYDYVDVLAKYICTGFLDTDVFINEVKTCVEDIKKKEESEETKTINAIQKWRSVKDEDLAGLIQTTLEKVESGDLSLYAYLPIFADFLMLEHYKIENFEVTPEIIQKFKNGIDKSKENHSYEATFDFRLSMWKNQSPLQAKFNELRQYLVQANTESLEWKATPLKQRLLESFRDNDSEELLKILQNAEYLNEPILEVAEPKELIELIEVAQPQTIYALNHGINFRYATEDYKSLPVFQKEEKFLKVLLEFVDKHIAETVDRRVSIVPFIDLKNTLERML